MVYGGNQGYTYYLVYPNRFAQQASGYGSGTITVSKDYKQVTIYVSYIYYGYQCIATGY